MGEYYWHDFVGNVGVGLILFCYLCLQLKKMRSDDLFYSLLNGAGAALILVSLAYEFNLSAFIIELAWVAISCIGVVQCFYQRRHPNADNKTSDGVSG